MAKDNAAAEKASAEGNGSSSKSTPAPAAPPIDTSKGLTILAVRAMWRVGLNWNAGATELTAEQADALGQPRLQLLKRDPNFAIAAAGTRAVTIVGAGTDSAALAAADTVVFAKRAMSRAGRGWNVGATPLDADQVKALGDKGIAALKADPNFEVVENAKAAAASAKTETPPAA